MKTIIIDTLDDTYIASDSHNVSCKIVICMRSEEGRNVTTFIQRSVPQLKFFIIMFGYTVRYWQMSQNKMRFWILNSIIVGCAKVINDSASTYIADDNMCLLNVWFRKFLQFDMAILLRTKQKSVGSLMHLCNVFHYTTYRSTFYAVSQGGKNLNSALLSSYYENDAILFCFRWNRNSANIKQLRHVPRFLVQITYLMVSQYNDRRNVWKSIWWL